MYDMELLVSGPLAMLLDWTGGPDAEDAASRCRSRCIASIGLRWSAGLEESGLLSGCALPRPGAEAEDSLARTAVAYAGEVPSGRQNDVASLSPEGRDLLHLLGRYVAGEAVEWPALEFPMQSLSQFTRDVLETLRTRVPRGHTVTYGQLAGMAGRSGAARGVGQIMARNRWPLLIPCHRVVGSNGSMVGFTGGGVDMKRYLLQLEGGIL